MKKLRGRETREEERETSHGVDEDDESVWKIGYKGRMHRLQ